MVSAAGPGLLGENITFQALHNTVFYPNTSLGVGFFLQQHSAVDVFSLGSAMKAKLQNCSSAIYFQSYIYAVGYFHKTAVLSSWSY